MKNSQKVLFSLLCVALCAMFFACASSGGGGGGAAASGSGEPVPGVFKFEPNDDSNDKGTSTIVMTEATETIDGVSVKTYRFKGEVTNKIQYGVVDATLTPDDSTLELLKTAKAISFKILGDGRPYNVEAPISTVTDWGFHRYKIETKAGEVTDVYIEMRMFMQPAWASIVRFNQARLTKFRIQSFNAAEGGMGPFEFKVWDVKVIP
jgi:hypothetical protein